MSLVRTAAIRFTMSSSGAHCCLNKTNEFARVSCCCWCDSTDCVCRVEWIAALWLEAASLSICLPVGDYQATTPNGILRGDELRPRPDGAHKVTKWCSALRGTGARPTGPGWHGSPTPGSARAAERAVRSPVRCLCVSHCLAKHLLPATSHCLSPRLDRCLVRSVCHLSEHSPALGHRIG